MHAYSSYSIQVLIDSSSIITKEGKTTLQQAFTKLSMSQISGLNAQGVPSHLSIFTNKYESVIYTCQV